MRPDDRPAEAERIGGEVREIVEAIRGPEPETDWRRGISRNAWALLALCSILIMACGVLVGRVSDNADRERAMILKTLDDQRKTNEWFNGRLSAVELGLERYGNDVGRVVGIVEDMRKDQLNSLRAAADRRGDDTAVAKYDRKLKALADSKSGGNP